VQRGRTFIVSHFDGGGDIVAELVPETAVPEVALTLEERGMLLRDVLKETHGKATLRRGKLIVCWVLGHTSDF
jgi:hypothetical protein